MIPRLARSSEFTIKEKQQIFVFSEQFQRESSSIAGDKSFDENANSLRIIIRLRNLAILKKVHAYRYGNIEESAFFTKKTVNVCLRSYWKDDENEIYVSSFRAGYL